VTPISSKPDAPSRPGGRRAARRLDFAARLKGRTRTLRVRLERRETFIDVVRAANATRDPVRLAESLVQQAERWIPAPYWAVVVQDPDGGPSMLAERGLGLGLGPSLWAAAQWVLHHGAELFTADIAHDARDESAAHGAAMAFPLMSRGGTVGALVALDPEPSASAPLLGPAILTAVRVLLEPMASALDNALALQKAEELSVTDDLTRLHNSRYMNQVLRRETKRAQRNGRPLSLIFLDLDGFKQVNDRHGHLAGSRALVEAAAVIRGCGRETDVVARFGGDEFALILPDTGGDGALSVAARIRDRLRAAHLLTSDGLSVRVTASIGVATLPDVAATAEDLLRAADVAMYRVKAAGKDGIHIAQGEELLPSSPSYS
jgi:diguanylate cyclase (GGDEF)-like protein